MSRALAALALALASGAGAAEIPRKVLALYDPRALPKAFPDPYYTDLHQRAEMPLNHLGLELVFRSLEEPLPEPASLSGYRGILVWLHPGERPPDADAYCRWLERAMDAGLKAALLGQPGVLAADRGELRMPGSCRAAFARLGLSFEARLPDPDPLFLEVERKDALVGFERAPSLRGIRELYLTRASPDARVHLRLRTRETPARASEPVVTGPAGGIALDPFLLYRNKEVSPEQVRWVLDPFAFFERAFALEGLPRPDATTANGLRIYYSHIDGDGIFNVSERDRRSWSGEVFLREVLERRPDSPVTVSLITGYYDMPRYSGGRALELSRRILALPNVEPASHGHAHPLVWSSGKVALELPGYRYDPGKEVLGSAELIDSRLLAAGRRTALFQWTGDCLPEDETIGLAAGRGMLNMNGGDSRFDRILESRAFLGPLSRKVGRFRQVYSSNANENVYTGLWRGPYYGYRDVIETFERTGEPTRLKPVNVYVHFYSAEKIASLKALEAAYQWAHSRPLFPMWAGTYAGLVEDFFAARLEAAGPGAFRVLGAPRLRTLRFDRESRSVDLARSRGVLGFSRHGDSLYVALEEAAERLVALSGRASTLPYVEQANFEVSGLRREGGALSFRKSGWWPPRLRLAGLAPGRAYLLRHAGGTLRASADPRGRAEFAWEGSELGGDPTPVSVEPLR